MRLNVDEDLPMELVCRVDYCRSITDLACFVGSCKAPHLYVLLFHSDIIHFLRSTSTNIHQNKYKLVKSALTSLKVNCIREY